MEEALDLSSDRILNELVNESFRSHYASGVDSASNRSEYQEYFLGVKAAGAQE